MRWRRDDWIELAAEQLRREGPPALTLDRLCAAAGRTRGSFYHHFESVERLLVELALRWSESETEGIASKAAEASGPVEILAKLVSLTDAIDHRLERGVRVMALSNVEIAAIVEAADTRREEVMSGLLVRAYALTAAEASNVARLLHALHQGALMRRPDDIKGYTRAAIRQLVGWLPVREGS